ncbi:hypothetical protein BB559_000816 [Furculomyces boomerangus]|uniref:BHLH domain-containing protein n=1 Tax=Furculomyces boomerangus TaxID=61424 RepID=A0A2T9Z447_9FUNG|nr:hypothetical protein BB559_000816 [Furculomyces boomerangus]
MNVQMKDACSQPNFIPNQNKIKNLGVYSAIDSIKTLVEPNNPLSSQQPSANSKLGDKDSVSSVPQNQQTANERAIIQENDTKTTLSTHQSSKPKKNRLNHNELEKKRRHHQRKVLFELKDAIPSLKLSKPSTVFIMQKAKDYIEFLHKSVHCLELEAFELRKLLSIPNHNIQLTKGKMPSSGQNSGILNPSQLHCYNMQNGMHGVMSAGNNSGLLYQEKNLVQQKHQDLDISSKDVPNYKPQLNMDKGNSKNTLESSGNKDMMNNQNNINSNSALQTLNNTILANSILGQDQVNLSNFLGVDSNGLTDLGILTDSDKCAMSLETTSAFIYSDGANSLQMGNSSIPDFNQSQNMMFSDIKQKQPSSQRVSMHERSHSQILANEKNIESEIKVLENSILGEPQNRIQFYSTTSTNETGNQASNNECLEKASKRQRIYEDTNIQSQNSFSTNEEHYPFSKEMFDISEAIKGGQLSTTSSLSMDNELVDYSYLLTPSNNGGDIFLGSSTSISAVNHKSPDFYRSDQIIFKHQQNGEHYLGTPQSSQLFGQSKEFTEQTQNQLNKISMDFMNVFQNL